MPWFKVDDTAHAHPKLLKAGNAALGLWMRAGSYAAQHLTEGAVPGVVAQLYGTAPQARKLVTAGLWHEHGHACPRCPQPPTGDFQIHDFLIYNPTRAQAEEKRAKAADRQQRARQKAAAKRSDQGRHRPDSPSNRPRIDDDSRAENRESAANRDAFPNVPAGQDGSSQRDGTDPSRSPRPDPTPPPPTEVDPPTPHGGKGAGRAEQMLATWWDRYGRRTAQGKRSVGQAIADALGNGIDARELWAALDRLGDMSKPVTGGTLQFALSDIRRAAAGAEVIPLAAAQAGRSRAQQGADHLAAALARRAGREAAQ